MWRFSLLLGTVLSTAWVVTAQTKIPVNRYTTSKVSDDEARTILEKGSGALRLEGSTTKCGLSLTLSDTVKAFTVGNGSVTSGDEFRNICKTGGYIHVVNSIGICGGSTADPGFTIIGCADTPGSCEVVVRLDSTQEEESLWIHEYGHTKGLQHRKGAKLLMNPSLDSADQVEVSQAECNQMKGANIASQRENPPAQPQGSISEFVRQVYFEGLPLDAARRYTKGDIPTLLAMLRNESDARYRPNIVAMLGIIGSDNVLDELMAFVNSPVDSSPRATYRAKLQVPISLGYMLHERGSDRAFQILKSGTQSEYWAKSAVKLPGTTTPEAAEMMVESSILGLGISGNREALAFLRSLDLRRYQKFATTLKQAIAANERVAQRGLH